MAEPALVKEEELPALYYHAVNAYKTMMNKSERDEATGVIVYEGYLVRDLAKHLNLSSPYYSYATKVLKDMGCIRLVRRGGGRSPSLWQLVKEPTKELWEEKVRAEDRTSTVRLGEQKNRFTALEARIDVLDKIVVKLSEDNEKLRRIIVSMDSAITELKNRKS